VATRKGDKEKAIRKAKRLFRNKNLKKAHAGDETREGKKV